MIRGLQVVNEHAQLRAETESSDVFIDEVQSMSKLFIQMSFLLFLKVNITATTICLRVQNLKLKTPVIF